MLLLLLVACGYDRTELDYAIDTRRERLSVVEHHRNAWHDTADGCATVADCRAALRGVLDDKLGNLAEAGGVDATGEVLLRGELIDVRFAYVLPWDAAMLASKDSWVRRMEVARPSGRTHDAVAFVDLGNDADTDYELIVEGRHRRLTMPSVEGRPVRMWLFQRGRGRLALAVDVRGDDGLPVRTPGWAPGVPGLLESLQAEPLRAP